jgi:hypothetical protein
VPCLYETRRPGLLTLVAVPVLVVVALLAWPIAVHRASRVDLPVALRAQ